MSQPGTTPRDGARNAVHEMYPYLCVGDVPQAIAFYCEVFGAQELFRLTEPSGRIGHVELQFAPNVVLMLSSPYPELGFVPPDAEAPRSLTIHLHVDNCDEMLERAVREGATMLRAPADQFYGERSCLMRDPFGHAWLLGHSIEQLQPDEMQRRYSTLLAESGG